MEWLHVSIRDHTMMLYCSKTVGGFQSQQLRENVYLAPSLGREIKGLLTVG
jgi:hypothetical protein